VGQGGSTCTGAPTEGSAATTVQFGLMPFTAVAMPEIIPPPESRARHLHLHLQSLTLTHSLTLTRTHSRGVRLVRFFTHVHQHGCSSNHDAFK
jgi:hypothetical protein